jgi:hypothetical protein
MAVLLLRPRMRSTLIGQSDCIRPGASNLRHHPDRAERSARVVILPVLVAGGCRPRGLGHQRSSPKLWTMQPYERHAFVGRVHLAGEANVRKRRALGSLQARGIFRSLPACDVLGMHASDIQARGPSQSRTPGGIIITADLSENANRRYKLRRWRIGARPNASRIGSRPRVSSDK